MEGLSAPLRAQVKAQVRLDIRLESLEKAAKKWSKKSGGAKVQSTEEDLTRLLSPLVIIIRTSQNNELSLKDWQSNLESIKDPSIRECICQDVELLKTGYGVEKALRLALCPRSEEIYKYPEHTRNLLKFIIGSGTPTKESSKRKAEETSGTLSDSDTSQQKRVCVQDNASLRSSSVGSEIVAPHVTGMLAPDPSISTSTDHVGDLLRDELLNAVFSSETFRHGFTNEVRDTFRRCFYKRKVENSSDWTIHTWLDSEFGSSLFRRHANGKKSLTLEVENLAPRWQAPIKTSHGWQSGTVGDLAVVTLPAKDFDALCYNQ